MKKPSKFPGLSARTLTPMTMPTGEPVRTGVLGLPDPAPVAYVPRWNLQDGSTGACVGIIRGEGPLEALTRHATDREIMAVGTLPVDRGDGLRGSHSYALTTPQGGQRLYSVSRYD